MLQITKTVMCDFRATAANFIRLHSVNLSAVVASLKQVATLREATAKKWLCQVTTTLPGTTLSLLLVPPKIFIPSEETKHIFVATVVTTIW